MSHKHAHTIVLITLITLIILITRITLSYMWVSKSPHGPSAKFLLQNVHTMSEVKLTGNCLKGAWGRGKRVCVCVKDERGVEGE